MEQNINQLIRNEYAGFLKELDSKYPYFQGNNFSNVFVTGVLDDWEDSINKILIVGLDAAWGEKEKYASRDEEISKMQQWVIKYLHDQIKESKYGFKKDQGYFWKRFRNIVNNLPKEKVAFAYCNLDIINNAIGNKKGNGLAKKDRKNLHNTKIKIVKSVINIIKPTVVLFCGWSSMEESYKQQLPEEVYKKFYTDFENCKIGDNKLYKSEHNGVCYILSFHPRYTYQTKMKEYENQLIEVIRSQIKKTNKEVKSENNKLKDHL